MFCQLEMSRIQYFFKELQDEGQNIENQGKGMIVFSATPQQYNKKPVKIDQGLDFLKVWRGKSKKTIGKTQENNEQIEIKSSGSKFLTYFFLIPFWGCILTQ